MTTEFQAGLGASRHAALPTMFDFDQPTSAASDSTWQAPQPAQQLIATGRALRQQVPRRDLGTVTSRPRDPVAIISEQNITRLPEFLPLRTERMRQSAFAFYRGTAAIMAADFAAEPHSGLLVPSCGDAHISNFGFYASPLRTLVFDLNDFDEAAWAPWEWDLKRMVASVVIAGQSSGRGDDVIGTAVRSAVRSYAAVVRHNSLRSPLERYYARIDPESDRNNLHPASQKVVNRAIKQAKKRTGERAVHKLSTREPNGRLRFVEQPPTMVRLPAEVEHRLNGLVQSYLATVNTDISLLFQHYTISDAIRRVVGVGSVGTRCALSLLQDGDDHAMILQSKEAGPSVLVQYGRIPQPQRLTQLVEQHGHGARVVAVQRILQAVSDPFLGYLKFDDLDLYVRQFHDMKGSIEAEELDDEPFVTYAMACAVTLARAHSQAPLVPLISGYVGRGEALGHVLLEWGYAYADRARDDYSAFVAATDNTTRTETVTADE